MSTNLYMRPVPRIQPKAQELPYELKRPLARRFWDHDGSLCGDVVRLGPEQVSYLEGLADGGVEGAADMAAAIIEHGAVDIWIDG